MLRIGICDDSAEARLGLRAMLERLLDKRAVECQIYEFSSGEGLLGWMEKHTGEIDLVFLDIEMGGLNGSMEAAKALRERSDALQLVFVTGYTDFVFDGYAVGALGYVMKPPQPEQIGDVLTRALAAQFNEADKVFLCRNTDGLFRIPKKSIRYFYSDRRQVTCVTDTRRLTFYARLDDVAEAVGADKLIFLTDTDGILVDSHNQSTRIAKMDVSRAKELMDSGLIAGGMIPKTLNCIHAVEHGVGSVTVLDGRMEHAILLEAISEKSLGTTMEKKR